MPITHLTQCSTESFSGVSAFKMETSSNCLGMQNYFSLVLSHCFPYKKKVCIYDANLISLWTIKMGYSHLGGKGRLCLQNKSWSDALKCKIIAEKAKKKKKLDGAARL